MAIAALAVAAIAAGVLWLTARVTRDSSLRQLLSRDNHALQLYVANIRRELSQYAYLPKLLANDRRVLDLLDDPRDGRSRAIADHYLEFVAQASGAAAIYIMTRQGLTLASSNWNKPDSFVGQNYGFRPYFQQAMHGKLGRYYALGTSSGLRGYYFAYPVRAHGRISGVVTVKVPLDSLEAQHDEAQYEFVVTDPNGIIFLSTRPAWRYHALAPLADDTRLRVTASRRYADHAITPLSVLDEAPFADSVVLLTLKDKDRESAATYLEHGTYMPEAGWRVYIFSDVRPVEGYVVHSVVLAGFVLGAIVLLGLIIRQRRARLAERVHYEHATMQTAAALDTNRRLTREIEEHRRTEIELRRTRDELVQAAKLAAIGQLSAGINHELNQPLMAIRFFADNARTFLERSRLTDVRDNLIQIDGLTDRMGKIVHQLKLFARKSSGQPVPVSMAAVADGALALLMPRLKRENVVVRKSLPMEDVYCLGDLVRLEQVVVNLVGNAIQAQAMSGQASPCVEILIGRRETRVSLAVRDRGPGIPDADLPQIFDPFFTTKESGEGLGLGLSISLRIIEELGGTMRAANHADGGAVFTIEVPGVPEQESGNE